MFVIAGVSGRTGSVVADTLLSAGKEVRVVVRDAAKGEVWRERGAEVAVASLDDRGSLARALEGAEGLYALLPEDPTARDFHADRRRMADAIAAAVRASRVPHVVFLSAIAAALRDGNGPASDLHYAESALRGTGAIVTVVRSCYFQENVLTALPAARCEAIYPSFFPSDVAFPMIATRDVGRFAARCLLEPPSESETIDLVGPTYSIRDLAQALGAAIGRDLRVVEVPPDAQLDVLTTKAGLPRPFAEALVEMFACVASGRITPRGDRMMAGTTTLGEILPDLLRSTR